MIKLNKGGRYNWKNQPERLIYLGYNWSGNGHWHQFAKVEEPEVVWCECLDSDLANIEETPEEMVPKYKVDSLIQDIERLEAEVAELRAKKFTRFNDDECWIYQGDGEDYLESLVCPVVISAADLMAILNKVAVASKALEFYADEEHAYETRYQDQDDKFQKENPTFQHGKSGAYNENGSFFYEDGTVAQTALDEIGG